MPVFDTWYGFEILLRFNIQPYKMKNETGTQIVALMELDCHSEDLVISQDELGDMAGEKDIGAVLLVPHFDWL